MPVQTHVNEVMIYYDHRSSNAKKVLAMARTVSPHVRELEYHKSPLTNTLLRDLLKKLNLRPKDILNRAHPFYQQNIAGKEFNMEGWLNIISHNPDLIKSAIAVKGKKAVLCTNPTDILRLK